MDFPVSGSCDARFLRVKEEFTRNFAERGEVGAAVHVIVDGTTVVDLAGGWRDAERRRHWELGTLVDFYSVGKPFLALLALQLVDEGRIALDDPSRPRGPSSRPAARRGPRSATPCATVPRYRPSASR